MFKNYFINNCNSYVFISIFVPQSNTRTMNRTALYLLALCESEIFHSGLDLIAMIHKNRVHVFHNINWDHKKRVLEPETVNSFQDVIDFMDKANNELSTTPDREGEAVDTRYEESRELQLA